jgi:hypothetical protein
MVNIQGGYDNPVIGANRNAPRYSLGLLPQVITEEDTALPTINSVPTAVSTQVAGAAQGRGRSGRGTRSRRPMGEEEEDPEVAEESGFSNGKAILVIAIVVIL